MIITPRSILRAAEARIYEDSRRIDAESNIGRDVSIARGFKILLPGQEKVAQAFIRRRHYQQLLHGRGPLLDSPAIPPRSYASGIRHDDAICITANFTPIILPHGGEKALMNFAIGLLGDMPRDAFFRCLDDTASPRLVATLLLTFPMGLRSIFVAPHVAAAVPPWPPQRTVPSITGAAGTGNSHSSNAKTLLAYISFSGIDITYRCTTRATYRNKR